MKNIFNKRSRKRTAELKNKAQQMGMQFQASEDFSSVNLLADISLFNIGARKELSNIFNEPQNNLEESVRIYDYQYMVSSGNSMAYYSQTVFEVQSKALDLPHFRIRPKNILHRLLSKAGFYQKNILFDHEEFNKYFLLKTDEPNRLKETLALDVIELLAKDKKLYIEGINYFLAIYQVGKFLPANQIPQFHQTGYRILNLLKSSQNNLG